MLDDNVTSTYVVEIEDLKSGAGQARLRPIAAQPCGFSTPMLGVESLLDKQEDWVTRRGNPDQKKVGADQEEVHFSSFRVTNEKPDESVNFITWDVVCGNKLNALRECETFLDPKKDQNPKNVRTLTQPHNPNPNPNPSP